MVHHHKSVLSFFIHQIDLKFQNKYVNIMIYIYIIQLKYIFFENGYKKLNSGYNWFDTCVQSCTLNHIVIK
jgi:hypothetical protein